MEQMTRRTTSQQLQFLRDQLAAELDRENPDIDTINHIQRDMQRMEKRRKCMMKYNDGDCDCDINHCIECGW